MDGFKRKRKPLAEYIHGLYLYNSRISSVRQAEGAGRNVLCMKMRHWNMKVSILFISGRTGVHEECFLTIAVCPHGSVLELG